MKKILTVLLCLLCLFISCSDGGDRNSDALEEAAKPKRNLFECDIEDGVSLMVASARIGNNSTRAIETTDNSENILVSMNDNNEMTPLVFRNSDNENIIFTVRSANAVSSNSFLVDFNSMIISSSTPTVRALADTPNVNVENERRYEFDGQLIVNGTTGQGAFLTPVDFSGFKRTESGVFKNPELQIYPIFDLTSGIVLGDDLYLTTIGSKASRKTVYRISLVKPDAAIPMVHSDYVHLSKVISGTDNALLIHGQIDNDSGLFLVDRHIKTAPKYVDPVGKSSDILIDGFGCGVDNLGNFRNEINLDGSYWNIQVANKVRTFYKDSNGNPLKDPLSDGFAYAGKWVNPMYITEVGDGYIIFNGYRHVLNIDELNCYYTLKRIDYPVNGGTNNKPVYDFRRKLEKGFLIGDEYIKPAEVSYLGYKYEDVGYPIGVDADGYVYRAYKLCYPTINGNRVADYHNFGEGFVLDGKTITPTSLSSEGLYVGEHYYRYYRDKYNFIYMLANDKTYLKDSNQNLIHDDRLYMDKGIYSNGKYIELQSHKSDYTEVTDVNGNKYYLTSDKTNGRYKISYDEKTYLRDVDEKPIKSILGKLKDGIQYYDGTPVDCLEISNEGMKVDGVYYRFHYDAEGNLYTDSVNQNMIVASEIKVDDALNIVVGKQSVCKLDLADLDLSKYRLLNILKVAENAYNMYFYRDAPANISGASSSVVVVQLDINTGKIAVVSENDKIGAIKVPVFDYLTNRNNYWSPEKDSIVWAKGGHCLCWIDKDANKLCSLDLDTGRYEDVVLKNTLASSTLTRIGDNLIYSVFDTPTEVNTYSVPFKNLNGVHELTKQDKMKIWPLLEIKL